MSGALSAIGTVAGVASLLFQSDRSITGSDGTTIIPDLAIRERHRDAMGITAHPVENTGDGASMPVTDHAFKLPAELELSYGWSNSSIAALSGDFTDSLSPSASLDNFGEGYVRQVYQTLLKLQKSAQLCTIVTGKRLYKNMLIAEVSTETSSETAYSMYVTFRCLEVMLVTTQTTRGPNAANMAAQQTNAPPQEMGTKQLQPTQKQSALYQLGSSIFGF